MDGGVCFRYGAIVDAHFDGTAWSLDPTAPDAARAGDGITTFTVVGGEPDATWLATPGPRFFRKPVGSP